MRWIAITAGLCTVTFCAGFLYAAACAAGALKEGRLDDTIAELRRRENARRFR